MTVREAAPVWRAGADDGEELGAGRPGAHLNDTTNATAEEPTPFLELFLRVRRGVIGQPFHAAAADGAGTPEAVIRWVQADCIDKIGCEWTSEDRRQELRDLLWALGSDRQDALRFAQKVLDWRALPPAEREKRKAERAEAARLEWMATKEPTEKQIALLRKLGYSGEVTDRAQASRMIGGLLARQKGRRP